MARPAHRTTPRVGWARRLLWTVPTSLLVFGVLLAAPAAADPARPTDYRSELDEIVPEVAGIRVEVIGGDAFLWLRTDHVDGGRPEVVVLGYHGEPYLRFRADGVVEENRRSEAAFVNDDRYGEVVAPPGLDADEEPDWVQVGSGGSYAWHDHRIHWMFQQDPIVEEIDGESKVMDWVVPLVVDGEPVEIRGSLEVEEPPQPGAWLVAAGGLSLVLWAAGRRSPLGAAVAAAGAGSIVAAVAGWIEWSSLPQQARGSSLVVLLPAVAVGAWIVAAVALGRNRASVSVVATLASASATVVWAASRLSVLTNAVLVTPLAPTLDRLATVVALGAGVAAAALAVGSGRLGSRRNGSAATG